MKKIILGVFIVVILLLTVPYTSHMDPLAFGLFFAAFPIFIPFIIAPFVMIFAFYKINTLKQSGRISSTEALLAFVGTITILIIACNLYIKLYLLK